MDEAILELIGWLREWRSVVSQLMPGCLSCIHPVASTNPTMFSVPVDTHCVPVEAPLYACRRSTVCLLKVHSVPVDAHYVPVEGP